MSQFIKDKVITIADEGSAFSSDVYSKEVELNNYQSAKVIIRTNAGSEAETIARVVSVLPDNSEGVVKEEKIKIGNSNVTEINVVANELAKVDAYKFKVNIVKVDGSDVTGSVTVVLSEARYSE